MNKLVLNVLINIDRMFNIMTGGDLGVTYSTRSYINSVRYPNNNFWRINIKVVDRIMFERDHCKKSYEWEIEMKKKWVLDNTL